MDIIAQHLVLLREGEPILSPCLPAPGVHRIKVVRGGRDCSATAPPYKLDAQIVLREKLPHPDLSPFLGNGDKGITLIEEDPDPYIRIPGEIEHDKAEEIEEAIWDRLHFASHLRTERLGEFTAGDEVKRSDSLALVQLLVLYHMVTAKAAVAMGGEGARSEDKAAEEPLGG